MVMEEGRCCWVKSVGHSSFAAIVRLDLAPKIIIGGVDFKSAANAALIHLFPSKRAEFSLNEGVIRFLRPSGRFENRHRQH